MRKKFFLIIPLFFIVYSFIFPCRPGADYCLLPVRDDSSSVRPGSGSNLRTEISDDGKSVLFMDNEGKFLGRYTGSAPFADADMAGSTIAAGFTDGTLAVTDDNGSFTELETDSPGSIEIIYSVDLTEDGRHIAVVSGLYPKKVLFFHKTQEQKWVQEGSVDISDHFRRHSFIYFSSEILLFEDLGGLTGIDIDNLERFSMEFDGELKKVLYNEDRELILVREGEWFRIFYNDGKLMAAVPCPDDRDMAMPDIKEM